MPESAIYTVGHSNRSLEMLLDVLESAGIEILVDVRAQPASGRFPHFSGDTLRGGVEERGMVYHWAGRQLGGMRPPRPDSRHIALDTNGLRGFADYMETGDFQRAVVQLLRLSASGRTAVLCAERQPEHCHRALIADYLVLNGHSVIHLVDAHSQHEHRLRSEVRRESAELIYDRMVSGTL